VSDVIANFSLGHNTELQTLYLNHVGAVVPSLLSQVKSLKELTRIVIHVDRIPLLSDVRDVWDEVDRVLDESQFSDNRTVTIEFSDVEDLLNGIEIACERLPLCAARNFTFTSCQ
jgi:hypothetical protein